MIKDKIMNEATRSNLPQAISFYALLPAWAGLCGGSLFFVLFNFSVGNHSIIINF